MGNLILGVNTQVAYYFATLTRVALDPKIAANAGSVIDTAAAENGKLGIVVDFVSIGNNLINTIVDFDEKNGILNIVYTYYGLKNPTFTRKLVEVLKFTDFKTQHITTNVLFIEQPPAGGIPNSDTESDTTEVPQHDEDVPGKANDD